MGKLVYGDLIRADKLKPGQYIEKDGVIHEIMGIEIFSGFGHGRFKKSYMIKLSGENITGGQAWHCALESQYLQTAIDLEEKKIIIFPALNKKEQPKKLKLKLKPKAMPIKKKLKIPTKR